MSENILEKIIQTKKVKIENLKKITDLNALKDAISKNNSFINFKKKIQSNIKNVKIVLLLDNIDTNTVKKISKKLIKNKLREYCILEASGGIDIDSLEDWGKTDIEVISSSKLNRGVSPIDLSMLFEKEVF